MFKRLILILVVVFLLTGCMPSPITEAKKSKIEQNMVVRSLASVGNNYRISQKISAAKKGKKTIIAYIGSSSLTNDENISTKSPAKLSFELIQKFIGKKANLEYINFNIKESTSFLSNLMLKKYILDKNPDIIFIDYAIYDIPKTECREAFETIIRNCLLNDNQPQVVIILNSKADGQPKQDFMEQIAKYYNLPFINVTSAVQPEIASGRMTKDKFYIDNFEVTDYGKNILSKFIEYYVKYSVKEKKDKKYIIPSPMYTGNNLQNIKFISPERIQADNFGSYFKSKTNHKYFAEKIEYMTNTENAPFLFTLDTSDIWIIAPVSSERNNIAEIYINNKKMPDINLKGNTLEDEPKAFKIYSSDKKNILTTAIRIKEIPEEQTNGTKIKSKSFEFWGIAYIDN